MGSKGRMGQLDIRYAKDPDWLPSVSRDITDANDASWSRNSAPPTSKHDTTRSGLLASLVRRSQELTCKVPTALLHLSRSS